MFLLSLLAHNLVNEAHHYFETTHTELLVEIGEIVKAIDKKH
jgi:hypothetical protein